MLDFTRRRQRRGAYPNVRRALIFYWTMKRELGNDFSFRAAFRLVSNRRPFPNRGSVEYQLRQGRSYDRELRACWGSLYETLVEETLSKE